MEHTPSYLASGHLNTYVIIPKIYMIACTAGRGNGNTANFVYKFLEFEESIVLMTQIYQYLQIEHAVYPMLNKIPQLHINL